MKKMIINKSDLNLKELSYADFVDMGFSEESLDKRLFGSDYTYYKDMDSGNIYEFVGEEFCGCWSEIYFKTWFCED